MCKHLRETIASLLGRVYIHNATIFFKRVTSLTVNCRQSGETSFASMDKSNRSIYNENIATHESNVRQKYNFQLGTAHYTRQTPFRVLNPDCNTLRDPRKSRIFPSKFRILPVTSSYIFTDLYDKLANRSPLEMVVETAKRARLQLYHRRDIL